MSYIREKSMATRGPGAIAAIDLVRYRSPLGYDYRLSPFTQYATQTTTSVPTSSKTISSGTPTTTTSASSKTGRTTTQALMQCWDKSWVDTMKGEACPPQPPPQPSPRLVPNLSTALTKETAPSHTTTVARTAAEAQTSAPKQPAVGVACSSNGSVYRAGSTRLICTNGAWERERALPPPPPLIDGSGGPPPPGWGSTVSVSPPSVSVKIPPSSSAPTFSSPYQTVPESPSRFPTALVIGGGVAAVAILYLLLRKS